MNKIKKVGVWPVGLVGGLNAETPVLDSSGKFIIFTLLVKQGELYRRKI